MARKKQTTKKKTTKAAKSTKKKTAKVKKETGPSYEEISFQSENENCSARLYKPPKTRKPWPVILMAHGFGAEKTFALPRFAELFANRGYAVFLFDYRGFGGSEGEPRNFVSAKRHLEDWQNALNFVQARPDLDQNRIGLWGTSFSGGHVLVTAARNPQVKTVLAQVPFVDGISSALKLGLWFIIKATLHGLIDIITSPFRKTPYQIPIVAPRGEFGVMSTPECYPGYMAMVDKESKWQNRCPARILLTAPFYRPTREVQNIECPVFLVSGAQDSLIDFRAVRKAAKKIRGAMLAEYEWGHFEVYSGEAFVQVTNNQMAFLQNTL